MGKTGVANLPLHSGKAPKWLFDRMVKLSRGIVDVILLEYGKDEFLKRISDPFWFQSLSCVLGFDCHSSGCTTVTCGALKEAIHPGEHGFAIAGGKGKASRKTIQQIEEIGETFGFTDSKIKELQYSSRMSAKVDSTAVQDSHTLYHHVFLFTEQGNWSVIQQGMRSDINYARRYHWLSGFDSFIVDPHNSIMGEKVDTVLDMTSKNSVSSQKTCVDLVCGHPRYLANDWASLIRLEDQTTLDEYNGSTTYSKHIVCLDMPRSINWNKMREIYEFQPKNYEELLSLRGVGPTTVRALALISDLIYDEKPSWKDPVKYSFAVGGKDGVPYPVDRKAMDESTALIQSGIERAKVGDTEKMHAIKRLKAFVSTDS
ncbi:MAG: DUF763 domain-containing protein [Candidatus Thermoplasmatota archaeon]|nr:DUF763 domain-containing protein [Candidatus Thermoplasmatota archaeon]